MAQLFPSLVIFLMLLDMSISVDYRDLLRVRHQRALVARTALSVLVLVPLVTLALSFIDAIPMQTRVALALLAAAPGAPLSSQRAAQLGSTLATAMALQLIVANLGVVTAPLTLYLMASLHGLHLLIPVGPLAWQLATVQLIPLVLGALLRWKFPDKMPRLSKTLSKVANLSMLVLIVMMLVMLGPVLLKLDGATWLALLAFASSALFMGHLLGGPARETRIAVAVASANRNLGLAALLGNLMGSSLQSVGEHVQPLIMAFALVNFLAGTTYKLCFRPPAALPTDDLEAVAP